MMTGAEGKDLRERHGRTAKLLSRMSRDDLAALHRTALRERGTILLHGGPQSKDELIGALLELDFPAARMNEASHVLHHQDLNWPACEWCKRAGDRMPVDTGPPFPDTGQDGPP